MGTFFLLTEIVGTVAFAVSGAMTAIRKDMDVFGVAILGLTTATGGGVIRDLILGINPPKAFRSPRYAMIAITTSLAVFIFSYLRTGSGRRSFYDAALLVMDTVGLAFFVISGMQTAISADAGAGAFLVIFVGVLTGVGGGVLRDIFAGDRPYIFVKHIYACAALAGAIIYYYLRGVLGDTPAMVLGISAVAAVRLLSAHYGWNLPHADHRSADGDS